MKQLVITKVEALRAKVESGNATKAEVIRLRNVERILSNDTDSGRWGKAFELMCVKATSRKCFVADPKHRDGYATINGKRVWCEYKTNGGRIGALLRLRKPENAYIIYAMDFETRQTYRKDGTPRPTKHYVVAPIILKVSDFLAILEHCNATKTIGHKDKGDYEPAIQGDSAKLAKCLADYPITFDPDLEYTSDDFEDLELW